MRAHYGAHGLHFGGIEEVGAYEQTGHIADIAREGPLARRLLPRPHAS